MEIAPLATYAADHFPTVFDLRGAKEKPAEV
jgi:hypothetical protein